MIYFDAGATTLQKPPAVAAAAARAISSCASPGRGGYPAAMRAADALFACRQLAGQMFDTEAEHVVFTMNATHALNLAIKSLVGPGDRVVISGFEHNAVRRPLHHIGAEICVAGQTLFDPEDTLRCFREALKPGTKAVVCTHVSNVFGYILPLEQIAALCRERSVPLIVDASQSAGVLPVRLRALGAAFVCMPGHKSLYGPQGTGLLLCGAQTKTLLEGGSGSDSRLDDMPTYLPDRLEAGTHNVCGICGLMEGLRFVRSRQPGSILRHEIALRTHLQTILRAVPSVCVYSGEPQAGTCSFTVDGTDCEQLAQALYARGIAVRAGLHCAPLAHASAGTLQSGTVRVSFSAFNTMEETDRFARALRAVLQKR